MNAGAVEIVNPLPISGRETQRNTSTQSVYKE